MNRDNSTVLSLCNVTNTKMLAIILQHISVLMYTLHSYDVTCQTYSIKTDKKDNGRNIHICYLEHTG